MINISNSKSNNGKITNKKSVKQNQILSLLKGKLIHIKQVMLNYKIKINWITPRK